MKRNRGHWVRTHKSASPGFTIIEVMLVLVIAALIIVIVFLAVPALQRNARNSRRHKDAALIAQAINECYINSGKRKTACDSPSEIGIDTTDLSIYTGIRYGGDNSNKPIPPTIDEPNWLFGLKCNAALNWFASDQGGPTFVVTYELENSPSNRCIDGQV